jgi:hypothetical protein
MIENFSTGLAKLLGFIAFALVLMLGLLSEISIGVTVFRAVIGAIIFAAMGYYMGEVIEKKREIILMNDEIDRVKAEKQKMKANVMANVANAVNQTNAGGGGRGVSEEDFAPLNVENLAKIIVDSLEE